MTDSIRWFLPVALLAVALLVAVVVLSVRLRRLRAAWSEARSELGQRLVQQESEVGGSYRSQEQFRQEIQQLGTAFWDWNLSPSRLRVSDRFVEFTGYRQSDLGAHPKDHLGLIHPAERKDVSDQFRQYLAGDRPDCELEFRFLFRDGEYRWVKSRIVASRGPGGQPERVVGSLVDISERVRAEEERDRLFNLSMDMLAVGNYEGYLQQVNPAWVRVLRWSRDDLMAEPVGHFIHADDAELYAEAQKRLEAGQPVEDLQCRFRCRDNTYRWLSWSSFPYPEQRQVFTVVRDITLQKEAESKLKDSQERLRSLSNQLSLVEDRQRRQLAEAIHDGLAQQLFAIRAQPFPAQDFYRQLAIGVILCFFVALIKNWARVLAITSNVLVIAFDGFAAMLKTDYMLVLMLGLVVVILFAASTFYLLKKDVADYFKRGGRPVEG